MNKGNNGLVDPGNLKSAMEVLKCLTHPVRLSILNFISAEKEVHVNKIYNSLKLEQSITSQHLRVLRDLEMVNTTRQGKFIIYSVNHNRIKSISQIVNGFMDAK